MWLITSGEHTGKLFKDEDEAVQHLEPIDFVLQGHYWISSKPVPRIGGYQDIKYIPKEWQQFVRGFRAAEAILGETNNEA